MKTIRTFGIGLAVLCMLASGLVLSSDRERDGKVSAKSKTQPQTAVVNNQTETTPKTTLSPSLTSNPQTEANQSNNIAKNPMSGEKIDWFASV